MGKDTQKIPDPNDIPELSFLFEILLFFGGMFWININWIPIIPIGAILGLVIFRPRKLRTYFLVLIAAAIGFVGTGPNVNFMKLKRINLDTGGEFYEYKAQFGVHFGTGTIYHLKNRNKVVIYDDQHKKTEVDQANAYVNKFIEHYNAGDPNFILETFVYQQGITTQQVQDIFTAVREIGGDITSSGYLGYLCWVYPKQEQTDITVVHSVEFEKDCDLKSIHFQLIFYPDGLKLTRIDFIDQKTEYNIVRNANVMNPFE